MERTALSGISLAFGQLGRIWAIAFSVWLVMFLTALALSLVNPTEPGMTQLLPITLSLGVLVTVAVVLMHIFIYRDLLGPLRWADVAGAVFFLMAFWAFVVVVLALADQLAPMAALAVGDTIYTDFSGTLRVTTAFYALPLAAAAAFIPLMLIYRGLIQRGALGEVDWGLAFGGAVVSGLAILVALMLMALTPYVLLPVIALLQAMGQGYSDGIQTFVVIADQVLKVLVFSLALGVATACLRQAVAGVWSDEDALDEPHTGVDDVARRAAHADQQPRRRPAPLSADRQRTRDPVIDWDALAVDGDAALTVVPRDGRDAERRRYWSE